MLEGIQTSRLDTLILLEDITGKDRAWLLAHPEFELKPIAIKKLQAMLERRAGHEPLAYIRGKSEFYGREFFVTADTLQPRPETETMIELLKKLKPTSKLIIADIGTGSGAIAVTVKLEWPGIEVHATEINKAALKIAKQNAQNLKANIAFYDGNLLEPLSAHHIKPSFLLCNLPYVPDSHTINQAAMQEPKIAIFGGPDGLRLYRQLFDQVKSMSTKPSYILTESLPFQHQALIDVARKASYHQTQANDFIQVFESDKP